MPVSSPKPVRGGISWLPPRLLPPRGHTRAATIAGQGTPKKTEGNRKSYLGKEEASWGAANRRVNLYVPLNGFNSEAPKE